MTGFTENIEQVVGVAVETEDGAAVLAITVVTRGGIRKTIRVPHYWADVLRSSLETAMCDMDDDARRRSFWVSAPGSDERKAATLGAKPV